MAVREERLGSLGGDQGDIGGIGEQSRKRCNMTIEEAKKREPRPKKRWGLSRSFHARPKANY